MTPHVMKYVASRPIEKPRPAVYPPQDRADRIVRWFGAMAFVSLLAFSTYASMLPFNFTEGAFDADWDFVFGKLWEGSRALGRIDLSTNCLLFILIGLGGGAGCDVGIRRPVRGVLGSLLILAVCLVVSLFNEISQIWLPGRVPSMSDVAAQSLGVAVGLIGWCLVGGFVRRSALPLVEQTTSLQRFDFLLRAYVPVLFLLTVYPLDVIVSPGDLIAKYRNGQIDLHPLSGIGWDKQLMFECLVQVMYYIPIGALTTRLGRSRSAELRSVLGSIALGMGIAGGMEFLQLFINSRYTLLGHVLVSTLGVAIGTLATHLLWRAGQPADRSIRWAAPRESATWLFVTLLCLVLPALYLLWPLDFLRDTAEIKSRLLSMSRVPFMDFYTTRPLHAARFIELCLLLVPFGASLGKWWSLTPLRLRWPAILASMAITVMVAMVIEGGQVLVVSRIADPTDGCLMIAGGWLGILLVKWLAPGEAKTPQRFFGEKISR